MKALHVIAFILLIVGGLNWLLVGIFDFDLVVYIFGASVVLTKAVYILVGLSALYLLVTHKKGCKECAAPSM